MALSFDGSHFDHLITVVGTRGFDFVSEPEPQNAPKDCVAEPLGREEERKGENEAPNACPPRNKAFTVNTADHQKKMVVDHGWWPDEDLEMSHEILENLQHEVYSALRTTLTNADFRNPAFPADAMEFTLPGISRDSDKGLREVPKEVLEKCLQPVMKGLQSMDATSLLDLKRVQHGAQLLSGVNVEGIHNKIEPRQEDGTVRYIHITEVPGQFTMGIFVFPPHGRIPLHDHPEMCVLSRVLYGDLDRLSLDLVREEDVETKSTASASSLLKSAWNSCRFGAASLPPKGSKQVLRNKVDRLVAPQCTALFPYEGNLHEFVAGPNGAAVLDVLLPPYDGKEGRDCTFYHIRDDDSMPLIQGRKACWIVPTGQPEDFHCISGWYGGLGLTDESDEHEDDHM